MFKFRPNGADAFSDCLNYEKKQYEKQRRVNISNLSIIHVTPHFANTMLPAVFIDLVKVQKCTSNLLYQF